MKKILLTISSLVVTFSSAQVWNISGNSGTNPSTDFLGTIDAQPLIFKTNNSEKARITPNGNVGIGTSNPQARLDVNGEVYSTLSSDEGGSISFFNPLKSGSNANRWSIYNMTGGYGNGLQFWSYSQSTGNYGSRMTLSDNGNVGIGTASPQAKLDVNGDIHLQGLGKIYGWNDPANYYIGKYSVTGSSGLDIHWYGGIKFGTAAGDAMQVLSNGNVGIGINTPTEKLDILGNIRIGSTHSTEGINALSIRYGSGSLNNWGSLRSSSATFMSFGVKASDTVADGWLSSDASLNSKLAMTISNGGFSFLSANQQSTAINSPVIMTEIMKITTAGNAALQGKLEAKEIKVTLTPTADFVFEKDYGLPKLEEVEKFIKENKHLPEIASAKEMEKEGVNVGEFQIKLLQKIEELTLYSIDLNKKNKEQEVLIKSQADILKSLHERLDKIEKIKQK